MNAKKTKLEIRGQSDDNIYVEGGNLTDQFCGYDKAKFLHFSDGTIFRVAYAIDDDTACWRIKPVKNGTATAIQTLVGDEADDAEDYSDHWTLEGELEWVECWDTPEGPDYDDLDEMFGDGIEGRNAQDQASLLLAYRLVKGHASAHDYVREASK